MTQTNESTEFTDAFREVKQESSTPLAGAGVFTGPWIDLGVGGGKISATARADQAGTLTIQESADETASQTIASAATAAVGGLQIASASVVTTKRFVRVVYTNGATGQGSFVLERFALA